VLSSSPSIELSWLGFNNDESLGAITIDPIKADLTPPSPYPPYPASLTISPEPLAPFAVEPGLQIRVTGKMQEFQSRYSTTGKPIKIYWAPGIYSALSSHVLVAETYTGSHEFGGVWYDVKFDAQEIMIQEPTEDHATIGHLYATFEGDNELIACESFWEPIMVVDGVHYVDITSEPDTGNKVQNPDIYLYPPRGYTNSRKLPVSGFLDERMWYFIAPLSWDYPSGSKHFNHWHIQHLDPNTYAIIQEEEIFSNKLNLIIDGPKAITSVYID
jgi:hypothetical protein